MIKIKPTAVFLLSLIIMLFGCVAGQSNPTPTIVPLERTATSPATPAVQGQAQAVDDAPPTATPIPPPSPTPTATRPASATSAETEAATSAPPTVSNSTTPEVEITLPQAEIVSYALNVRRGPGLAYDSIGAVSQGTILPVLGRTSSGDWLQVSYNNEVGWISGGPDYSRLTDGTAAIEALPVATPPPLPPDAVAPSAAPQTPSQSSAAGSQERLVFANRSGGELFSINLDGSDLRRLATGVIDPVVSPDGQQVAFTRWDGNDFGALYTLDLATGQERVVMGDVRQPKSPTWSPDGEQITISFQHGGRLDPKKECRNYEPGQQVRVPVNATVTWFKVRDDGTIGICFIRKEDLRWFLRQVDVASGAFEDLPSDLYAYSPTWDSANPWRVVYSGPGGLMQLDVNTGEQWPLTTDLRDTQPVFSPDSERLAITYKQHDHWEVYTFDPASNSRQRLTKPPILADPQYNSAAPAWSPDGEQLAFITDRNGQWEIWLMNADGSNQRPLLQPEAQADLALQYNGVNERLLNWLPAQ